MRQGKRFFFEKKKQKTFAPGVLTTKTNHPSPSLRGRLAVAIQGRCTKTSRKSPPATQRSALITLARLALCALPLFCTAAQAESYFYDLQIHLDYLHPPVNLGIYNDGHTTWNAETLSSPVALEAKLLSESKQKPKSFLQIIPHESGKQRVDPVLSMLRKYGFRYTVITKQPDN